MATGIGGLAGAIGGKGANGRSLREITNTSKHILKTAVSPKKIAMYTSKNAGVKNVIIESLSRTVAAGLASNQLNFFRRNLR